MCVCTSRATSQEEQKQKPRCKEIQSLVIVLSLCLPLVDLPQYLQNTHTRLSDANTCSACARVCARVKLWRRLKYLRLFTQSIGRVSVCLWAHVTSNAIPIYNFQSNII